MNLPLPIKIYVCWVLFVFLYGIFCTCIWLPDHYEEAEWIVYLHDHGIETKHTPFYILVWFIYFTIIVTVILIFWVIIVYC